MNDNIIDPIIEEDTEGHAIRNGRALRPGRAYKSGRDDVPETDEGDDTEGHVARSGR